MAKTEIEWASDTWNPTTGCDRVSPGCDHCYALTMAKRLKGMGAAKYQRDGDPRTSGPGFGITEHPDTLDAPLHWRKPRKVFVNSMSDLFHDGVSDEFIARVWAVMAATPQHTYQVLTKRHGRMRSLLSAGAFRAKVGAAIGEMEVRAPRRLPQITAEQATSATEAWPLPNVWLGVSVEDQKRAELRIPALLDTPAAVRFLSCEPLLGSVDLAQVDAFGFDRPTAIDWVIAGGESGPDHRPMDLDWVRVLRDQCIDNPTPFLFKQVGGRTPKAGGRELDGRTWDEYPAGAS
jgi:protein gp37